jgi:hypothetical protein
MRKTCFILSAIGVEGSDIRKLADEKFDLVYSPVVQMAFREMVIQMELMQSSDFSETIPYFEIRFLILQATYTE